MPTFPTLSDNPVYPFDPDGDIENAVLRSKTEGGYELTRPKFTRTRRNWGIRYESLPESDVDTLKNFERVTLGNGAGSFTWVHPVTLASYTVRLSSSIGYTRVWGRSFNVKISLREV